MPLARDNQLARIFVDFRDGTISWSVTTAITEQL
jgi:hypothetical protein